MPTDSELAKRQLGGDRKQELYGPYNGNIPLNNRPNVKNPDGSISTVKSISINVDGKETLIPRVIRDKSGKAYVASVKDAIQHHMKTGEHLGKFNSVKEANELVKILKLSSDEAISIFFAN